MTSKNRPDVILHPVRFRIILAVSDRQMTTGQIAAAMPDVPQATLYRHITILNSAGVLRVAGETPVRGTVERVYVLNAETVNLSNADFAGATREDHLRYFTGWVTSLLQQFAAFAQTGEPENLLGQFSYRTEVIHVSPAERDALRQQLLDLLRPAIENPLTPDRRRLLLSLAVIPEERESSGRDAAASAIPVEKVEKKEE